jgi:uncharacterized protein YbjQ (UPF0145 family)
LRRPGRRGGDAYDEPDRKDELKGMTKNLQLSREHVVNPMFAEGESEGGARGNAVLAMRFDTSEMGGDWTEICTQGAAVVVEPLG